MNSGSPATNPADGQIKELLAGMKRIAVVGLSDREDRASHGIARFLVGQGYEVVGVNPRLAASKLGVKMHASLSGVDGPIDVVDVFRRSEAVPAIVDAAIALGAGAVWLQEGVVHKEAAAKARAAGLIVVQDLCLYKEWLRLLNG